MSEPKPDAFAASDMPPGPYSYQTTAAHGAHHGMGHVYIVDAEGKKLCSVWGPPHRKMAMAHLIIEARKRWERR